MVEYASCSLCGGDSTELVFEVEEQITGDHEKFRIVKCKRCGLVYVNPRPCKGDITSYYPAETYDAHQLVGQRRNFRRCLKTLVWESLPGYSRRTGIFKRILGRLLGAILLRHVEIVVPFKENGRILDVGCGNGELIGWMKEYGWDTYGVDVGKKACEIAEKQGLKAFCGRLHEAGYPPEYFDVIAISHVLEHVHDPLALLRECNRVLKEDGLLILAAPNFGCFDCQLFGKSWYGIDAPRHLYHFTLDTLDAILNCAGFQVSKWKTKLRVPFYHTSSIKSYRRANPGFLPSCSVLFKASVGKFIKYILNKNRGTEFSINLVAYASKHD